jgi:hypothetical protein
MWRPFATTTCHGTSSSYYAHGHRQITNNWSNEWKRSITIHPTHTPLCFGTISVGFNMDSGMKSFRDLRLTANFHIIWRRTVSRYGFGRKHPRLDTLKKTTINFRMGGNKTETGPSAVRWINPLCSTKCSHEFTNKERNECHCHHSTAGPRVVDGGDGL